MGPSVFELPKGSELVDKLDDCRLNAFAVHFAQTANDPVNASEPSLPLYVEARRAVSRARSGCGLTPRAGTRPSSSR